MFSNQRLFPLAAFFLCLLQLLPPGHCSSELSPRHSLYPHSPRFYKAETFPSPRNNKTVTKCRLPTDAIPAGQPLFICDPDGVLSDEEKANLNRLLNKLAQEEENAKEDVSCPWGIHLGIAVAFERVSPATNKVGVQQQESAEKFIDHRWALDPRPGCQRTAMLVLASQDATLVAWCNQNLPVLQAEMEVLIGHQAELLRHRHFASALSNVISGVHRLAAHRIRILTEPAESGFFQGGALSLRWLLVTFPLLALLILLCCLFSTRDRWLQRRLGRQRQRNPEVEEMPRVERMSPGPAGTESRQLIVKMPPMQMYTFGGGNGIGTAMEMAAIPPSPSRQFLQKQPEEQQQS